MKQTILDEILTKVSRFLRSEIFFVTLVTLSTFAQFWTPHICSTPCVFKIIGLQIYFPVIKVLEIAVVNTQYKILNHLIIGLRLHIYFILYVHEIDPTITAAQLNRDLEMESYSIDISRHPSDSFQTPSRHQTDTLQTKHLQGPFCYISYH